MTILEIRVANQRQTLQNAIDNVNDGRYSFKNGVAFFRQFVTRVSKANDYNECYMLLGEADKQMWKGPGKSKKIKKPAKKGLLGRFWG